MLSLIKFLKVNFKTILWLMAAAIVMSWFIWRGCCNKISLLFWIWTLTACIWIALWLGNAYVSQSLDRIYSWYTDPLKRLGVGLVGMFVYTIGAVYSIIYFYRIVLGFEVGDQLEGTFISTISITLVITMFMTSRTFFANWRKASVDAERAKKESVTAQYESLKSQVNPHFLFNSLNALTNLVYEDQDKAAKFIKQLSEVYRYVLETRTKEVVNLAVELQFLESYFFLQKIRFGENLRIENKLDGVTSMIAPLALQLLVENAIKHNEVSTNHPLMIRLYQQGDSIIVENSLQKKVSLEEDSNGIGIDNIKKRYQFLAKQEVLVLETVDSFTVKLPIIEVDNE